ncbi:21069_t:CDS:2 [Cetraspora pellucida]|uniref:21069_t:CDS:1 n=1 Tax=Cetraspora pellucida TaxID=1433469 RepID=A0A9N9J3W8_9GLOM|nr:21069_t:CDS:2 [Cetraspora pellucida]
MGIEENQKQKWFRYWKNENSPKVTYKWSIPIASNVQPNSLDSSTLENSDGIVME